MEDNLIGKIAENEQNLFLTFVLLEDDLNVYSHKAQHFLEYLKRWMTTSFMEDDLN